jgi:aminoglycoside phosphotransferase (APT) family kinase protein
MLSLHDAALARRDPAVPGMPLLLDPPALSQRLQAINAALPELSAAYVRYKPGTSCLVAYRTEAGAPPSLYAVARHRDAGAKLHKARSTSDSGGLGTALLPDEHIEVRSIRHDAELPNLRRVLDQAFRRQMLVERAAHLPELHEATLRPLAYKPERRFVARLDGHAGGSAVLRLYARPRFDAAVIATAALRSAGMLHVPKCIGQSTRHQALLLEWLPGSPLRDALARADDAVSAIERVGAALALLHGQTDRRLPDAATAVLTADRQEAAAVAALQPHLGRRAAEVADRVEERLHRASPSRPLHGDFNADQVIVMDEGIGFLDLDRAHRGDPAEDLGNFLAHLERDAIAGRAPAVALDVLRAALLRGYAAADATLSDRVHVHTAAGLVRLAAEPFRCRAADWPRQMERIIERAGEIVLLPAPRPCHI